MVETVTFACVVKCARNLSITVVIGVAITSASIVGVAAAVFVDSLIGNVWVLV